MNPGTWKTSSATDHAQGIMHAAEGDTLTLSPLHYQLESISINQSINDIIMLYDDLCDEVMSIIIY